MTILHIFAEVPPPFNSQSTSQLNELIQKTPGLTQPIYDLQSYQNAEGYFSTGSVRVGETIAYIDNETQFDGPLPISKNSLKHLLSALILWHLRKLAALQPAIRDCTDPDGIETMQTHRQAVESIHTSTAPPPAETYQSASLPSGSPPSPSTVRQAAASALSGRLVRGDSDPDLSPSLSPNLSSNLSPKLSPKSSLVGAQRLNIYIDVDSICSLV